MFWLAILISLVIWSILVIVFSKFVPEDYLIFVVYPGGLLFMPILFLVAKVIV